MGSVCMSCTDVSLEDLFIYLGVDNVPITENSTRQPIAGSNFRWFLHLGQQVGSFLSRVIYDTIALC